jgi:putative hydrolase of the HAD superfamily
MKPTLVFDMDDTLYPERQFIRSGFAAVAKEVARRFGGSHDAVQATLLRALRGGRRAQALQELCTAHRLPGDLVPTLVDIIRGHAPRLRLPLESRETLRGVRGQGWAIGVLTNGRPDIQARKAAALGLSAYVDEIVFAEDWGSGRGKPEPEPFDVILERVGADRTATVYVGDDPWCDVFGARRAGLKTVLVDPRGKTSSRARACQADRVVRSIDEVPEAAARLLVREVARAA